MATALQDFRARYPQYNDRDDEELAEALYRKHYADMEPQDFRRRMGLPDNTPPPPPTMSERIDQQITVQDRKQNPLTPAMQELVSMAHDPKGELQTYFSDWQQASERGLVNNSVRLAAERGSSLLGHAVSFVGKGGQALEQKWGTGQIIFGSDWGPDDPADGKFRVRYMNPKEFEAFEREHEVRNVLTETVPGYLESRDFGGISRHTTQAIKDAYHNGEIVGTVGAVLAFGMEQGIQSIPDMLAVMSGLPGLAAYVGARSDEIGDVRAQNRGQVESDFKDNIEALPFALGSALFERFGASKIMQAFGKNSAEQVGKDILEAGLKQAAKRVAGRTGVAAITEAGTEAFQEGVLEYLGEKLGTDAPLTWEEGLERGFFGALGGMTFGGAAGGTLAVAGESTRLLDQQIVRQMADAQADELAATAEGDVATAEPEMTPIPDTDFDAEGNIITIDPEFDQGPKPPGPDEVTEAEAEAATPEPDSVPPDAEPTAPEPEQPPVPEPGPDPGPDVPHETSTEPTDDSTATIGEPEVFDPRMKREIFRINLAGMADELVQGGGITYIADENDVIIGRTPSENPAWFQALNQDPEYSMSVKQVRNAVEKALKGLPLGVRQARVVQAMLAEITGQRLEPATMDYARQQLEAGRATRAEARNAAELPPLDIYSDMVGEMLEETDYLPEMDGDARVLYDLTAMADSIDPERVSVILEGADSNQDAIIGLERFLDDNQVDPASIESAQAAESARPPAEIPAVRPGPDEVTDGIAQALATAIGRFQMEEQGQAMLDEMTEENRSPRRTSRRFWSSTYFKLNAETQARFQRMLKGLGFQPGDVGFIAADGTVNVLDDWLAVGEFIGEDLAEAEHLEGTERGYVVLMEWANQQALAAAGIEGDLLGDDTSAAQALADETRRRDEARSTGQDSIETGDPSDLFSAARDQVDLIDELARQDRQEPAVEGEVAPSDPWLGERTVSAEETARTLDARADYLESIIEGLEAPRSINEIRQLLLDVENIDTASPIGQYLFHQGLALHRQYKGATLFDQPSAKAAELLELEAPVERRVDLQRRQRVSELSLDAMVDELYTDPLTGLGNRRGFEEELPNAAAVGSIDIDGLSGVNDHLGHNLGDALIRAVGEALANTDADAFHISGDEFYVLADTEAEVANAINRAKQELARLVLEGPRGKVTSINITSGVGTSKAAADAQMEATKKTKQAAGLRTPKGQLPRGGVLYSSRPLNMEAGSNFVGMIRQHGDLPLDENQNYQLGNGRTVRIPEKPVRRKHVMDVLRRKFGIKIFQGRVKGRTKLGFYRPGHGEIRIKNQNDLEVTAHEMSHWLDDRHPWIGRLYQKYREEMLQVSYDNKLDYEGYAEFMRLWFTQEHQARQAAPGFYDAWMSELERHPGIKSVAFELQELMHAWYLQGARKRLEDRYGKQDIPIADRVRHIFDGLQDRILQKVFDGIRPFKEIERQVRGSLGRAAFSGYKTLRLARGSHGIMQAILHRGTINWTEDGDLEFTGSGIKHIFDPVSDRMTEMMNYMVARRAQELTEQGRENHIRPDEIERGLRFGKDDPQLAEVFEEWLKFNNRMFDFYESSGIMGADQRAAIEEMNKNYVPFNRIVDSMLGEKVKRGGGSPFMRLKGGTGNINDIFESIVGNTAQLVQMSLVNVGKRNFYQMLDAADNQTAGMYAAPIGREVKPTRIQRDQVVKAMIEGMGLTMSWYRMAKTGLVATDEEAALVTALEQMAKGLEPMVMFFQTGMEPTGSVDYYFDNGKKKFYEIIDPLLMEAINQLGPRVHNLAANLLGGFANVLRRGVTLTPTFQAKNFIRDTMNAFTLSKGQIVPAASATKALLERLYNDEHYWQYMVNGGGFASMADAEGINRDRVMDGSRKLFHLLDQGLAAAEYANRIAEFKVLKAKGWNARDAALAGREISTDFAMRGSSEILRWFTLSVPFMNARLQGLYRNARELATLEQGRLKFAGKQAFSYGLRSLIAITTPSLILYALNKDDERYNELPDWIRDLSWVIFTGDGEDDYVMIPKPFETGMLWGTLPERMIEYYYKHDEAELADAMLWMMLETFAMNPIPQAFKVWDDLAKNKNFTGAPIIPGYLETVEPMEQYRAYTSDTMIALGRKLNISPIKAEYIVRGHLGTLGSWALGMADMLVGDINNSGAQPTRNWKDNVLMAPFVKHGPLRRTHSEDHLFEMLNETQKIVNTVRIITNRSPDRIEEYISQPRKQIMTALNDDLIQWAKNMRELNVAIDQITADPDLTGDEKQLEIFALRRAKNEISSAVRDNINPELVQSLVEEAEAAELRSRAAASAQ